MKTAITMLLGVSLLVFSGGASTKRTTITDVYDLTMKVHTPRIYDNMQSLGSRGYRKDTLKGELWISYSLDNSEPATMQITNLVNKSYKIGGANVKYDVYFDGEVAPRVNMIGNNKTKKFKTASVALEIICDPSYNIGEIDEDNTLYIKLGGKGRVSKKLRNGCQVIKTVKGGFGGTLGCGCSAHGHVSPTRSNGWCGPRQDAVDDVAAVWGTWKMTWRRAFVE